MANKIPKQVQEFGRIGGLGAGLVGIGFGVYAIYKTCFYTGRSTPMTAVLTFC